MYTKKNLGALFLSILYDFKILMKSQEPRFYL